MSLPARSPLPVSPTLAELSSVEFLESRSKRSRAVTPLSALKTAMWTVPTILLLGPVAALSQRLLASSRPPAVMPADAPSELAALPPPSASEREYDIVIAGATGFTGKLVLEFYLTQYPNLKIAVAGRNASKLADLVSTVKEIAKSSAHVPIIVADASDWEANFKVARSARVVVTLAGPFAKLGQKLIDACAHSGTHYADITGETGWVRQNVHRLSGKAEETGAVLTSLCGHDSVPWEFTAKALEAKLKENGEDLVRLDLLDEMAGQASGGTIATMVNSVEDPIANPKASFDPMYGTSKKVGKVVNSSPFFVRKSKADADTYESFFMMSVVNVEAIKRSLELPSKVMYSEGEKVSLATGINNTLSLYASLCFLYIPPLRRLLLSKGIIPNPGTGPSLKTQEHGFLRVSGKATGSNGGTARSCIYFDSDPGYRDTARMVAEAGVTLLENGDKKAGGVFTPGAVIREEMTEKLLKGGTSFVVE